MIIFLLFFAFINATIINIPADYITFYDAISASVNGDTILVQPGTYLENINYAGKNITIGSLFLTTQDTSYISQTILDGFQNGSVVTFDSSEDSTEVLTGFTVTNGYTYNNGGGIYCDNLSSPKLDNLRIINNSSDEDGGGIYCIDNSNINLENVIISNNSVVESGGGIYCHSSDLNLENVIISNNSAVDSGGGILCYSSDLNFKNVIISNNNAYLGGGILCSYCTLILTDVTINENAANNSGGGIYFNNSSSSIENVTISSNTSNQGGGIFCSSSDPLFTNVTISNNTAADYGGGIFCGGLSNPELVNCILWNISSHEVFLNQSSTILISYSDIQGGESGIFNNNGSVFWLIGNIDSEPLFVDSLNSDFHLQWDSPCIDSGHPDLDGDGIAWLTDPDDQDPDGTRMDMGAYYHDQHLPKVDFIANVTSGLYPLTVQFTDLSTIGNLGSSIDSWGWDFDNDGTEDSNEQNPTYIYNLPGNYTVSLTVTDNLFENIRIKHNYILVQNIINVPGDYSTIQGGINASLDGETVLVQPGVYYENITFLGKNVTVASLYLTTQDTTYISQTVIDGGQLNSVVIFEGGEDSTSVLLGFTITNGYANGMGSGQGGGIYCNSSSPTIMNCNITNNSTDGEGGGIGCLNASSPSIIACCISDNYSDYGGGIRIHNSEINVEKCLLFNNNASYSGSAICSWTGSNMIISNCTFYNNIGGYAAITVPNGSNAEITNTILWNDNPAEIYGYGNFIINYSNIQGGYAGTGNLNIDPIFIDPENGNFNLEWNSPCIDAGDPTSPYDQDGTIADMGAFYYDQRKPIADFTADVTFGNFPLTVQFTDLSTIGNLGSSIDSWSWDFDNDGIEDSYLQNPIYTYNMPGIYTVSLTVTDDGFEDTEIKEDYIGVDQEIVVNDIQPTPGAVTINEMETIDFFFSGYDPDGNPLEYSWKLEGVEVSIDSTYLFETNYTSAGLYLLTLDVTDNFSDNSIYYEWNVTVTDVDQEIVVNDIQPTPGFITINENEIINFFIDAYDPDGNNLEFSWKLDGIEESTTSTYDFITDYSSAGDYIVTLEVTDNFGTDRISRNVSRNTLNFLWNVTVIDVDQEIVVNDIQPPPGTVTIDEMETIDFFFSGFDPDGNSLAFSWELDGVEVSVDSTYLFITDYTSAGVYLVTLNVTDNFNDRNNTSRNELNYSWAVLVIDVDQTIVVNEILPAPGEVIINETENINFSFSGYDPDGNLLEYIWELNGVEVSIDSTYLFTTDYTSAGEYVVTLEVTDNFGTDRISRNVSRNTLNFLWNVTVIDVDQYIIVNNLSYADSIGGIWQTIDQTIDESDSLMFFIDATDPDGNPLEYHWQLDGEEVSMDSFYTFLTDFNSAGEYEVTLYVTDNFGTRDELNFLWNVTVNNVVGSSGILIPTITKLYQNHPNPFNPVTNIQFDIKENETGILSIFNLKGQIIETQRFNSGKHDYLWNAKDCSSGIYFYKLKAGDLQKVKKMLLLK
jgi:predicted outer membrane repeat protein